MNRKPRGPQWEYYGECKLFCGARPGQPCIHVRTAANLPTKQRRMGTTWAPPALAHPHPGREKFETPARTKPRRSLMCPHWHPAYPPRALMCGRPEHSDPSHAHASGAFGVIHWNAAAQRNLPDYTPRHLREEEQ